MRIPLDWPRAGAWLGHIGVIVLAGGAYKEFAPTDAGATLLIHELIEDHTIG